MKSIIKKALACSLSYSDYKISHGMTLNKELHRPEKDLALINYLKLNQSRMNRIEKKFELTKFHRDSISDTTPIYTWLVITEPWCGDAAQTLPILKKMSSNCSKVELRIVHRDQHPELMNLFLTRGSKSIPKLIALDSDLNLMFTWGPRPKEAQKIVDKYIRLYKSLTKEGQIELQSWYNKDGGKSVETELCDLIQLTLQKK
ncbi:MAG: thioredoxin family protein [Flavobacteriaceae bacterium]